MIFVLTRPQGHKLASTVLDGTIANDGTGFAVMVTAFAHGLSDGDYVYIQSNISSYNGFKYITVGNPTAFFFSELLISDLQEYIQDSVATYKVSVLDHSVIAAHNPIVYSLYTNLYPTNTAGESYYPSTILSHEEDNGYTKLFLSGNLEDPTALSWIQVDGVAYQIIMMVTDSVVIINHAYNAADAFLGPIVKYYNNYVLNINVYAGFDSSHPWYSVKPFELAATLPFIPDAGGQIKFSISEIVRSYITTRNKLDLDTLPNNLDFSTEFYIEYFETYDQSDGVQVTTVRGDSQSDIEFKGLAINAQMPFKREDISFLSDYLSDDVYLAQWLTLQTTMTWIVGKFMDLSFLNAPANLGLDLLINGELQVGVLGDVGIGVIRVPLTFDAAGEYCVQVYKSAIAPRVGSTIDITTMTNGCSGTWVLGATPFVNLNAGGIDSGYLTGPFLSDAGVDHTFSFALTISGGAGTPIIKVRIALLDASCNILGYNDTLYSTAGAKTDTVVITPSSNGTLVAVWVENISLIYAKTMTLTGLTFDGSSGLTASPYTDSYRITVVDECDNTIIPSGDFRLLEDGDFRLLE